MKKGLLLTLFVLLALFRLSAQTLPVISTEGNETWYYIQFLNGKAVLQDMGEAQILKTKKAVLNEEAQLWKITGSAGNYQITSKLGRNLYYNGSRYYTYNSKVSKMQLYSTGNGSYAPAWELQRSGVNTQSMNQVGGAGAEKDLGEWTANDANNPLQFLLPEDIELVLPLPEKPAEVAMSGNAAAPLSKYSLWYRYPATDWMTQALPIGNGEFGAMIFGGVAQDEIQFNDKTLWSGHKTSYGAYQNFGSLFVNSPLVKSVENYRRELDLENAVARVSYMSEGVRYTREYISSNPDSAVYVNFSASASGKINVELMLWNSHGKGPKYTSDGATFEGKLDLLNFYARMAIQNDGGSVEVLNDRIRVSDANALTIVLKGGTNYDPISKTYTYNASLLKPNVDRVVEAAISNDYVRAKDRHIQDHKQYFGRMSLEFANTKNTLPTNELISTYNAGSKNIFLDELYFHYGRYLLIGSSRGLDSPANLQGIWNNSNTPPWSSDIHANINVQMNYWLAENTNLSELHNPFLNYIYNEAMVQPQWKQNAKDAGQTKGWVLYTENNIFGWHGSFMKNYVIANAWYCMHMWQHYRYTDDVAFLKNVAYPVMKSCSEFWMERLIEDRIAKDGTLVCPNEYSPEHGPSEDATAHSQQLVWDLFNSTLKAMEILGDAVSGDASFKSELKDKFGRLDTGLHIDEDGHLREWKYSDKSVGEPGHRHMSHLMGLYPGSQISPLIDKTVFDAAITSLDARGDGATGWSMGWKINLWARALDGERAYKILKNALKHSTGGSGGIYENLFDAHPPFQIDGNFGATAGITEMLIQSHTDTLQILPSLPDAWQAGTACGIRTIGNFEVDLSWNYGLASTIVIRSKMGKNCAIDYPRIAKATIVDAAGKEVAKTVLADNRVVFETEAGQSYSISLLSNGDESMITPAYQVNTAAKTEGRVIELNKGDRLQLYADASTTGKWYWSGPNGYSSSSSTTSRINFAAISPAQAGEYIVGFVANNREVSTDTFKVKVIGEASFVTSPDPSNLEAENYNYGGQGLAFNALDEVNAGGVYRNDGIDVYAVDNEENYYIGLKATEWTKYSFNLDRQTRYIVRLKAKSASTAKVSIQINNEIPEELTIDPSNTFDTFEGTVKYDLKKAAHNVIVKCIEGEVYIDAISVDAYFLKNQLLEGNYSIQFNGRYLTNEHEKGTTSFAYFRNKIEDDVELTQGWYISVEPLTQRYKIVSLKDSCYLDEAGRFQNESSKPYNPQSHTMNIYFDDILYAIQTAGNVGEFYWNYGSSHITTSSVDQSPYPINFKFNLDKYDIQTSNPTISAQELNIYMNGETLYVEGENISQIKVLNIYGVPMITTTQQVINVANLASNSYLIVVTMNDHKVVTKKLFIK